MRRVILTLLACALLVWVLVPQRAPAPVVPEGATISPEPAAAAQPASSAVAPGVSTVPAKAEPASATAPDYGASTPARKTDVGQQLREELKGVMGGGGGLSKYNPFDY